MEATEYHFSSWFLSLKGLLLLKWKKAQMPAADGRNTKRWPTKRMGCAFEYEPFTFLWMFLMFWVTDFSWCFFLFCSWLCRCCQMEEFCGAVSCSLYLLLLSYCSYHEYCYYGYYNNYYYYFIVISCWQLKRHVVHYEPFLCLKLYI